MVFLTLAGLVGYFANRASMCTVKAVAEILTTRRAYMLGSFVKTIAWVIGITAWISWSRASAPLAAQTYALVWSGLLCGILFGIGAVFNGGCAISTLTRLGNGNLGMAATLAGIAAGMGLYALSSVRIEGLLRTPAEPLLSLSDRTATVLGIIVTLWMLWESVRLIRTTRHMAWRERWLAPQLRLSTAAAVIGVSNGILYAFLGTWSYTHTLRRSITELTTPVSAAVPSMVLLWGLFAALSLGVLAASVFSGRFSLSWRPRSAWLGYFAGGLLMGLGAALVPGGNDVLLLNAIPGMSPHALPAFVAMLVGIWVTLVIMKMIRGSLQEISCSGDLCREVATNIGK